MASALATSRNPDCDNSALSPQACPPDELSTYLYAPDETGSAPALLAFRPSILWGPCCKLDLGRGIGKNLAFEAVAVLVGQGCLGVGLSTGLAAGVVRKALVLGSFGAGCHHTL